MNPFFQAMDQGYSEEDILSYLSKAIPKVSRPIQNASRMGYNAKQILGYLSKVMNPEQRDLKGKSESEIHNLNAQQDLERTRRGLSMAATAVAAPLAASAASSALSRSLPSSLKNLSHQFAGNSAQGVASLAGNSPVAPSEVLSDSVNHNTNMLGQSQQLGQQVATSSHPPINQSAANIPEPTNIQQPKEKSNIVDKLWMSFEKGRDSGFDFESDAFLKVAKRMKSTGEIKSKEDFQRFFDLFDQKKNEGKGLPESLREASGEYDNQKLSPSPNEPVEEPKKVELPKIEKNSVVNSPQGLGEVKSVRNGQALVEVDGKLHKVKEEDLEPPEFSEDEIADAYDNIMAKIPEKERSGFISWAGYDEDRNVLGFIPRGGKYEELTNITPEEAKMIKEGSGIARTSGEEREGLWVKGEETRGGIISQIIWDRKHKKEASEKQQGKFDFNLPKPEKEDKGMKPVFDEMAHARGLSRVRDKRKKEEEKARKKKEKDEAKKRKK